jgi:hypothetical protein
MNADGAAQTYLASGWGPRWSSNGEFVAFTMQAGRASSGVAAIAVNRSLRGTTTMFGHHVTWKP